MTPADRSAASAALASGRTVFSRLDQIRGPEDAAADIIDLWTAAESAMRSMLGGSSLSGQALVRELRTRGVLDLESANALASFWDAKSRADDVGYKPTLTDVGYARAGYGALERAVSSAPTTGAAGFASAPAASPFAPGATVPPATPMAAAGVGATSAPPIAKPAPELVATPARRGAPLGLILGAVAAIAVILGLGYLLTHRSSYDSEMAAAAQMMSEGRTEGARTAFSKIASENPTQSDPHVFLSRLARADNDMSGAKAQLDTAIRLSPNNARAFREMGLVLLAENNNDLARSFLLRAVKADTADRASQGYLACALSRLNRVDEAQRFAARAGTGAWSTCATGGAIPTAVGTRTTP